MDLISIIVPIYNAEEYLPDCINAIINQTYKNIEIILINDGSSDNSLSICKKYSNIDNRIKIVDKINQGVSVARNVGIDISKGKYITFIDSDDIVSQNYIEILHNNIITFNVDFVVTNYIKDGKKAFELKYDRPVLLDKENFVYVYKNSGIFDVCWGNLIKKEVIEKNHIIFDKQYDLAEDTLFTFMCYLNSKSIMYIPDLIYEYRVVKGSLSRPQNTEKIFKRIIDYSSVLKYILEKLRNDGIKIKSKFAYLDCLILEYLEVCNDTYSEFKTKFYKELNCNVKAISKYSNIFNTKGFFRKLDLIILKFNSIFLYYYIHKIFNYIKKIK